MKPPAIAAPPTITLQDRAGTFESLWLEPAAVTTIVLFAAGAGGDPARHLPLLEALAEDGCLVAAPVFSPLPAPAPRASDLDGRLQRLRAALDEAGRDAPVVGIGHSIGASLLLILAGARATTLDGSAVSATPRVPFRKLMLMAPPTAFFRPAGALDQFRSPTDLWVGGQDRITPPAELREFYAALNRHATSRLCIEPDADHFAFMHTRPPTAPPPAPNYDAFLQRLTAEALSAVRDTPSH